MGMRDPGHEEEAAPNPGLIVTLYYMTTGGVEGWLTDANGYWSKRFHQEERS